MSTLVTGIAELLTNDPSLGDGDSGTVLDAAVVVDRGTVAWVGAMRRAPAADVRVDVDGRAVMPGFVDSHTHLVFGGDRAGEFEARMAGVRYDGGGIASTVDATRAARGGRSWPFLLREGRGARSVRAPCRCSHGPGSVVRRLRPRLTQAQVRAATRVGLRVAG